MALILIIESATISCSVALSQNGKTLAVKEITERNIHASHITLFIEDVLKQTGYTINDLDAVAVSMGPGSYTGLRIGVSTAKGLCYALDIPLIAVNTLVGMANGIKDNYPKDRVLLCPMIDARRMEVYTAVFNVDLNEILTTEAKIIDQKSFADLLSTHKMIFFGDGAEKCKQTLEHHNAIFLPDFINSAKDLAELAFQKFTTNQFEDVVYFEPYYLKDFLVTQPKAIF